MHDDVWTVVIDKGAIQAQLPLEEAGGEHHALAPVQEPGDVPIPAKWGHRLPLGGGRYAHDRCEQKGPAYTTPNPS